jgi:hypothetical protein
VSVAAYSADFQGARVLVINDSQTIRRTAENVLTRAGCEVRTAQDGFEALGKIVEFQPNLVFVDADRRVVNAPWGASRRSSSIGAFFGASMTYLFRKSAPAAVTPTPADEYPTAPRVDPGPPSWT